jgi:hypothetical protein
MDEDWRFRGSFVPPVRQATLRVRVDKGDGPGADSFSLNRDVSCQRRFASAALL